LGGRLVFAHLIRLVASRALIVPFNLAGTKNKIIGAGIVPALVNLFMDLQSNEDVLEKMLWLITNLTLDHPENR